MSLEHANILIQYRNYCSMTIQSSISNLVVAALTCFEQPAHLQKTFKKEEVNSLKNVNFHYYSFKIFPQF